MANDIAAFFDSEPDKAVAAEGVRFHMTRFWDPRMRREIIAHVQARRGGAYAPTAKSAVALAELIAQINRSERAMRSRRAGRHVSIAPHDFKPRGQAGRPQVRRHRRAHSAQGHRPVEAVCRPPSCCAAAWTPSTSPSRRARAWPWIRAPWRGCCRIAASRPSSRSPAAIAIASPCSPTC